MISIGPRKKVDRELIWWFEIPASDIHRARLFYESILRIKMTLDENEAYKTAFFPIFKDRIGGAIVEGQGYTPSGDGSKIYLNGHPDLQDILNRVEPAGGKILIHKTKSASNNYAWILDSEGNKIALFSEE